MQNDHHHHHHAPAKMKTEYKRYDLTDISTEGNTYKDSFELDAHSKRVIGLLVTSNNDNLLFNRGTIGIKLNGKEITPDEYHAKLLMSGLSVAPDHRYLSTDLEVGNLVLKTEYKDNAHPTVVFSAYKVYLYVLVELHDDSA